MRTCLMLKIKEEKKNDSDYSTKENITGCLRERKLRNMKESKNLKRQVKISKGIEESHLVVHKARKVRHSRLSLSQKHERIINLMIIMNLSPLTLNRKHIHYLQCPRKVNTLHLK